MLGASEIATPAKSPVQVRVGSNLSPVDPLGTPSPPLTDNTNSAVLVPPINPNSAFANKVTTGEGKVTLGWPSTAAAAAAVSATKSLFMMNKPLPSRESSALQQQQPLVEDSYRTVYEQCAAELHAYEWFKTITPEELATPEHYTDEFRLLVRDLESMEAAGFINIIGSDRNNRKVILICASRLQVLDCYSVIADTD